MFEKNELLNGFNKNRIHMIHNKIQSFSISDFQQNEIGKSAAE